MKYAFIAGHEKVFRVRSMCRMLHVHPSGFYAWKVCPQSQRARDDERLVGLLKHAWLESGGVYGYRKLTLDMRELGESCSKHRVARLLKQEGLQAQRGYRRRPRAQSAEVSVVAPNTLERQFTPSQPNQAWVTDITYIRTHEGWLYLSVVLDLFSRQVIGWSMASRIDTQLVLDALLMAIWRRKPTHTVLVHSDQGCQFTSEAWQSFLQSYGLQASMSRRGNCHDNAVAESFFQLLKRERIRKKIYATRSQARGDIFNYIEMFYNSQRRHSHADGLSPIEFERRYFLRLESI